MVIILLNHHLYESKAETCAAVANSRSTVLGTPEGSTQPQLNGREFTWTLPPFEGDVGAIHTTLIYTV